MNFQPIEIRDTKNGIQMIGFDDAIAKASHYISSADIKDISQSVLLAIVVSIVAVCIFRLFRNAIVDSSRLEELKVQQAHEQIMKYGRTEDQRCEYCGRAW